MHILVKNVLVLVNEIKKYMQCHGPIDRYSIHNQIYIGRKVSSLTLGLTQFGNVESESDQILFILCVHLKVISLPRIPSYQ